MRMKEQVEKVSKMAESPLVRMGLYGIGLAFSAGMLYAAVKDLPTFQATVAEHTVKIARVEEKQAATDKTLDRIEKRTEDIYKLLLRGR